MSFSSETQHHYPLSFTNRHNNPLVENKRHHHQSAQQHVCMDLQQVLAEYDTEPEMLKLILRCKIEEDKRHTAEARLKAKELDLMWVQSQLAARCQHNAAAAASTHNDFSILSKRTSTTSSYDEDEDDHQRRRRDSAAAAMIAMGSTPSPCNYYPTRYVKSKGMNEWSSNDDYNNGAGAVMRI